MSLKVWLPLNGNLNNQGLSNVDLSQSKMNFTTDGKIGKAGNFNGAKYIAIDNTPLTGNIEDFSLCYWIKIPNPTSQNMCFYTGRTEVGGAIALFNLGGKLRFDDGEQHYIGYNIPPDTWFHLVITRNKDLISCYINGTLLATYPSVPFTTTATMATIGISTENALTNFGNGFLGYMNDIRIYDHCLSAKEVKEISKGLCLHYKLNNRGWGNENLIENGREEFFGVVPEYSENTSNRIEIKQWVNCVTPNPNETYTCSFDAKSSIDKCVLTVYLHNSGAEFIHVVKTINSQGIVFHAFDGHTDLVLTSNYKRYWITWQFNDSTNIITKHLLFRLFCNPNYNPNYTGETVTIKNVKLERGSKATSWCPNKADVLYNTLGLNSDIEPDCSGYGYNGTRVGTLYCDTDSPRYDSASEFKNSGYITNSDFNVNTPQFTLSMWVKPQENINNQHMLLGTFSNWKSNGIDLWRNIASSNIYRGIIYSDAESSKLEFSIPIVTNDWNMLTITYDGTTILIYVDGILNITKTYGNNGNIINPVFMIANSTYNNAPANEQEEASISDVRFYATALSEEDIKELYKTSASIANNGTLLAYEFKEE